MAKLDANRYQKLEGKNRELAAGIVVIGRNEGRRLRRCLTSIIDQPQSPIIYVDSGSSDGSVNMARTLGASVIELDCSVPFSMARARNIGFQHLVADNPQTRFVQFIDGDCEMETGWLAEAVHFLANNETTVAVCGHLFERNPSGSIYNYLAGLEWQGPVGPIEACGGIAMYRTETFAAVGGFNTSMIAGEEPELCSRLRGSGQILRIDKAMGTHDAAITHFSQWWRRSVRGGHALANRYFLHRKNQESQQDREEDRRLLREVVSRLIYGVGLSVIWLSGIIAALIQGSYWIGFLVSIFAIVVLAKPTLGAYLYRRALGNTNKDAALYSIFCTIGKCPESLGVLKFFVDRLFKRNAALIEYKKVGN